MFFENLIQLCNDNNTTPNAVCLALGLSPAAATKWRSGAVPRETTLLKIADYFGITVEDLKADSTPTPKLEPKAGTAFFLTAQEAKVLTAYRNQPDMQPAVDKLLGVTDNGVIVLSQAAKSAEHRKPGYEQKPVEKWTAIENAPETDDDLL